MNKRSDFQEFCRTNWIMFKYDVLPWVVVFGLLGAGVTWANKKYGASIKAKTEMVNSATSKTK